MNQKEKEWKKHTKAVARRLKPTWRALYGNFAQGKGEKRKLMLRLEEVDHCLQIAIQDLYEPKYFALWVAKQALSLVKTPDVRLVEALRLSDLHAKNKVSDFELELAKDAARDAYDYMTEKANAFIGSEMNNSIGAINSYVEAEAAASVICAIGAVDRQSPWVAAWATTISAAKTYAESMGTASRIEWYRASLVATESYYQYAITKLAEQE